MTTSEFVTLPGMKVPPARRQGRRGARVTINRPETSNAVDESAHASMTGAWRAPLADDYVRAVVITAQEGVIHGR